jgi:hypothetical protein
MGQMMATVATGWCSEHLLSKPALLEPSSALFASSDFLGLPGSASLAVVIASSPSDPK